MFIYCFFFLGGLLYEVNHFFHGHGFGRAACLAGHRTGSNANIIVNGDFSANASSYVVYPGNDSKKSSTAVTNPASPTGWAGSTNDGVQGTDVGFTPKTSFSPTSVNGVTDYAFIHFASTLSQSFTVTPGATYTVSFEAASQSGQTPPTLTAYVLDGTTSKTNPLASNSPTLSSASFNPVSFNFTAGTASTDTLLFETSTNNNAADITDVSIAPVPEPAAMGLFGVGALGLLLARRQKA